MNRYEELSAFVGVVEHGGFSAAAERMGNAKSAVSRRVGDLEARLGVRLLNRTTRRLSLTDAGRVLHERALRILADWEEAEQTVSADSTQLSGRLKIAAPLSFGIRYLGPVVAGFATAHPEVQMEVDLGDREADLVEEGFDLAIRIGELADSTLVARRLTTVDMVCVASTAYFDTHDRPEAPEELNRHQGLRYTHAKRGATWRFRDRDGRVHQARPRTVLVANNGDHIAQACEAGLGVAMLPLFIAHDGIRRGTLERVLTDYRLDAVGMYLVYPPGRYTSRRVQVFSGHIADHIREKPPWEDCPAVKEGS